MSCVVHGVAQKYQCCASVRLIFGKYPYNWCIYTYIVRDRLIKW